MKKHLRISFNIVLFTTIFLQLQSQEILFQTSFYFEDGLGNKDTIVFGYEDVDTMRIDATQGEKPITEPWDSVFEVRLVQGDHYFHYFDEVVKRERNYWAYDGNYFDTLISYSSRIETVPECRSPASVFFFFPTKNLPIKISWDAQDFQQDKCHFGSLIKAHYLEALIESHWWLDADSVTYACLANENSFVLEKTPDNYGPWNLYFQLYDDVNQDDELDTLWGFHIQLNQYIHPDNFPCYYFVQNEELESVRPGNTLEFKKETVCINAVEESSLMIYDYSGRLRYTQAMTRGKHEVSKNTLGLSPGVYIAQLRSESSQEAISKKMVVYE